MWIVIPVFAVLVRGIHWDEHAEFAPIWLGNVEYPEYHPLVVWITYVKNVQILASAAILQLSDNPDLINAFRNILFLWATCIPAYLAGFALTKRQLAGHAAVILLLFDLHTPFSSNYPWYTWPHFFSTGHVGRGFTMLGFALLMLNKPRTALLLIGFVPSIHLGQAPVLLVVTAIYLFKQLKTESTIDVARAAAWLLPGLLLFATLWITQSEPPQIPETSIYYSDADPGPIIRGYLEMDPHRAKPGTWIPYTNGNILLLFATLISLGLAYQSRKDASFRHPTFLLAVYITLCTAVVWSAMLLHLILDDRIPLLIIGAMPYRFANHVTYLLPILFLATLHARGLFNNVLAPLAFGLIAYPLLQFVFPEYIYATHLTSNGLSVFIMLGIMTGCVTLRPPGENVSKLSVAIVVTALLITSISHQLGAVAIMAGIALAILADYHLTRRQVVINQAWTAAIMVVSLGTLLIQQYRIPSYYSPNSFHTKISQTLADSDHPGAAILAPHDQVGLQSRIDYPVLVDYPLKTNIPYHHYLAPTIEKMYSELYGLSFLDATESYERDWRQTWRDRTLDDWQILADQWEFRYILSPADTELPLDAVIRSDHEVLYRIPK